ncbi:LacI family DNA-binding transcriptional regulator [Halocella sp. SP3-1]|uniref:LacI family DNA-binding transcriptional regulator n=1 Tax=Halocella sp. SP3-1 TaxID=2382161 RepID=UPI000F7645E5|nr:LacI family DNA-binding transcriptional regulator [Halocella sp. SP3-1]AZO95824.1 LacI family transcriptional regulator [Halocella sp. SP3-1]
MEKNTIKKVNLDDIAATAGVSKATVSNALNDKKGVSEQTKEEILRIASDMGYKKANSNNGSNGEKKAVRIILYKKHGYVYSDTPFFANLIEGIQKECRVEDYEMMVTHLTEGLDDFGSIIQDIKNDESSGYLILATEMIKEDLEQFKVLNKPLVLLDSYFKHEDFDFVLINNFEAAFKATNYLIQHGHSRIGYLHSSVYINNFYYRKQGFRSTLQEHGIEINEKYQFNLEPTLEGSYRDMSEFLKHNPALPTAFFADNDIIAFGAMKALQEKGIKIPEEVSIIGFDDMPYCEISTPKMTTVRVPKQYYGGLVVKRLIEKINNNDLQNQKIEINTELIARESVLKR